MLQLTGRAGTALRDVRTEQHVPEHFGLRISGDISAANAGLHLNFVEEPVAGDQVGDSDGMKLFVASDLADPLADLVIDVDMQSPAGDLGLTLREQGDAGE